MKTMKHALNPTLSLVLLAFSSAAIASPLSPAEQAASDAAAAQQNQPVLVAPKDSSLRIEMSTDADKETPAGGPVVELRKLIFSGNTLYSEAELMAHLGEVTGKSYDLAGFRQLSNQISLFYRTKGYPFARAFIPAQDMKDGELTVRVQEGYYGKVQVKTKDQGLQTFMQEFLLPMQPGDPIESKKLERAMLLMNDVPGMKAVPAIGPGELTGTGDLTVLVAPEKTTKGDISIDNLGARYTGYNRVNAGFKRAQLFTYGDEIDLRGMLSDDNLLYGRAAYSFPLAPNGLRGNVSYSRTQYELGKDFASLQLFGVSDQFAAGLTYPVLRTQLNNIYVSATLQRKELTDDIRSVGTKQSKSSDTLPLVMSFDSRDQVGGGGITYGSAGLTLGTINNPGDFANTQGAFEKLNIDVARIQMLPANFSAFAKFSGQYAVKNLDSSEDFFLGGSSAVRAYPQGEGSGDNGYMATIELRYQAGNFAPYAFMDAGRVTTYAKPTEQLLQEEREITGGGVGVRYTRNQWNMDLSAAWRNAGGTPKADTFEDPKPRVLLSVGYKF
jgi:hemolysin activation/secretion protein